MMLGFSQTALSIGGYLWVPLHKTQAVFSIPAVALRTPTTLFLNLLATAPTVVLWVSDKTTLVLIAPFEWDRVLFQAYHRGEPLLVPPPMLAHTAFGFGTNNMRPTFVLQKPVF